MTHEVCISRRYTTQLRRNRVEMQVKNGKLNGLLPSVLSSSTLADESSSLGAAPMNH